ncbi:MAG TPA: transposase [Paludibacter sp.]
MKKIFIGIDFSKLKFDVAIYNGEMNQKMGSQEFDNKLSGFKELLKWIILIAGSKYNEWIFCGEHTGLYSYALPVFLSEKHIDICLESGLQIKRTLGIQRGKTDSVDAIRIAEYAYRHKDKLQLFNPLSDVLDGLKDLLAYRERLIKAKKMFQISSKELKSVKKKGVISEYIVLDSNSEMVSLETKLKSCEIQIKELIKSKLCLLENYEFLTSIKGIGMVNAAAVLVITANFTLFTDPRKFGCYCGVVPFKHSSGTSVKGRTKISNFANKKIKSLLTQAARTCVMHDLEMKTYYQRKIAEGKKDRIVINNVRNKLIHKMFAVISNRTMYNPNYMNPLKQAS